MIYQFNWTEMSGGFDQQVNIEANSEEKAKEIFIENVGKDRWKVISLNEWPKYLGCQNLNEKYTLEYIEKLNLKIHFKE